MPLSGPFASPIPWVGKEQASMPVGPTLLWSVPCSSVLRGYVTCSHPTEKGGLFTHRLLLCPHCSKWPLPRAPAQAECGHVLGQSHSHCPLGAWVQAPARRLRGCFIRSGLDQHGGGLQRVVAAPPRLPEDALLTLLPLPRNGVEVLAVKVRVAASTKPPASCQNKRGHG